MTTSAHVAMRCPLHGKPMVRRPKGLNETADWCGTWWDAQCCHSSILVQSEELKAELQAQGAQQRLALEARR